MIIVTGSVVARPDAVEEVEAQALAHVRRSREEPGCLLHSVHRDVEDPNRFVFIEHWADKAALATHFQVPASGAFVEAARALSSGPTTLEIYEAEAIRSLD